MLSPTFSLLILLNFIDLQSLVLSLGGMDRNEPFMLVPTIPGVRVVSPASGERVNPIHVHDILPPRAKHHHEAWTTAGLGLRLVSESVQPIRTIVYSNMFSILGSRISHVSQ